jgi:hypothetical protein
VHNRTGANDNGQPAPGPAQVRVTVYAGPVDTACPTCRGWCCYTESREGTVRYAKAYAHGVGVQHACPDCKDGTATTGGAGA